MAAKFLNVTVLLEALNRSSFQTRKWFDLGLKLGLRKNTLQNIEADHNRDGVERCLCECLQKWIDRADEVDKYGGPTFDTLVNAVRSMGLNSAADGIKVNQILHKHSESILQLPLPTMVVQTLYREEIISKQISNDLEDSEGYLTYPQLTVLYTSMSENPNQLRQFATVLQQSEDTLCVANDILKEYNKGFSHLLQVGNQHSEDEPSHLSTLENQHELHLAPTYQYNFDLIKTKFGDLIDMVSPLIESTVSGSLKKFKTYIRRCFPELKSQLTQANSFDDIMELVEEKCTIINVACLEAIVDHYKIEEAKAHITAYKTEIDKFCEDVKFSMCEKFTIGQSSPLKCETVEFVLEWKTDEHTFSEIEGLLWKAFEDMAKRVLVKEAKKGNSITVTCYAPRKIMDLLLIEAQSNLDLLKKMGVIKLTVGYCTVWDARKRYEEASLHEIELTEKLAAKEDEMEELMQSTFQIKKVLEMELEYEKKKSKEQQCNISELESHLEQKHRLHEIELTEKLAAKEDEMEELMQSTFQIKKVFEMELEYEKEKSKEQQCNIWKLESDLEQKHNNEEELLLEKEKLQFEITSIKDELCNWRDKMTSSLMVLNQVFSELPISFEEQDALEAKEDEFEESEDNSEEEKRSHGTADC